jgi:catechol 2,3-dioxygenase-like lactoylglutathione lyase family enzyme
VSVFLQTAAPTFAVADIAKTIAWYREHFDVHADTFPDHEPFLWATIWRDDVEIMLLRVEGYEKPDLRPMRRAGVWDVYLRTTGILDLYAKLEGKVETLSRPTRMPYGLVEFAVRDPNGYILVFGDDAPDADVPGVKEG